MTQEVSNWGRWGPDDQLGMLNILNAESVLSAVRLVKKGVVYNLAVPLEKDGPQAPTFYKTWRVTYFSDGPNPDGSGCVDDVLTMESHSGTHIDALARIHRFGAALGLEQGVRAVGRDGPRSIPINGAGGGLWLELVAPMAVLGSGAGAGSAGQHAREDNRGPGRCDSVGWLSSLVDVSGAVGAVRQAMAELAIEPGRE